MDDQLRIHLRNERELAFTDLGRVDVAQVSTHDYQNFASVLGGRSPPTWIMIADFVMNISDMLWALFHLARQVKSRCQNQIRIGLQHIDLGVIPLDVDLGRRDGLLPDRLSTGNLQ